MVLIFRAHRLHQQVAKYIWHWENLSYVLSLSLARWLTRALTLKLFLSFAMPKSLFYSIPPSLSSTHTLFSVDAFDSIYSVNGFIYGYSFVCFELWPRTALICANECRKRYLLSVVKWNCRIGILFVISNFFFVCACTYLALFGCSIYIYIYIRSIIAYEQHTCT